MGTAFADYNEGRNIKLIMVFFNKGKIEIRFTLTLGLGEITDEVFEKTN